MPIDVQLSIKDSGRLEIVREARFEMTVGIHAPEGSLEHEGGSGMNIATLAELHEYGAGPIPARSWLRKWAASKGRQVVADLKEALTYMAERQDYSNPAWVNLIAESAKKTMADRILNGQISPKNKASTLRNKAPENRPLMETGQLVNAIEAAVTAESPLNWRFRTEGGAEDSGVKQGPRQQGRP